MYKAEVVNSWKPLSTVEKFNLRDTSSAVGINALCEENGGKFEIENIINTATVQIHNDKVKEGNSTDYENFYVIDSDGIAYYTSSETLVSDIEAITDLVNQEEKPVVGFSIIVKVLPSKSQRQGFMKASLKAIIYESGEVVG